MFNYSAELNKLNNKWKKLRIDYSKLKMSEKDIEELYQFDLAILRRDRIFYSHLYHEKNSNEINNEKEGMLELLHMEYQIMESSKWIDDISNEELRRKLMSMKKSDIELLTLFVFEKYSQVEIAIIKNTSRQNINNKIKRIKKVLEGYLIKT